MSRQTVTAEDIKRQNQKKGLRPGVEGLDSRFDIKPGKPITNLFALQDSLATQKIETRSQGQELNAMQAQAPRAITAEDADAVTAALRKGEVPELGTDPLTQITEAQREVDRMRMAIDLADRTTTIEITQQLRSGSYLQKLHDTWTKEYGWQASDDMPHGEVKAHEGRLEEFVSYAIPLVIALEVAMHPDATNAEMQTLRKEMNALPEVLPSIASIRKATRSRRADQVVDKAIEARKVAKAAQSEVDREEAAEAARYRASGRKDQAASNSDVVERTAAHAEKVKANAAASK